MSYVFTTEILINKNGSLGLIRIREAQELAHYGGMPSPISSSSSRSFLTKTLAALFRILRIPIREEQLKTKHEDDQEIHLIKTHEN